MLLTPDAQGRRLVDEPALFALEIQNEDSFFFWTFNPEQIPDAQMQILEGQFAAWLRQNHGSLEAALAKWGGQKVKRDNLTEGRVGFRPLWNMANALAFAPMRAALPALQAVRFLIDAVPAQTSAPRTLAERALWTIELFERHASQQRAWR